MPMSWKDQAKLAQYETIRAALSELTAACEAEFCSEDTEEEPDDSKVAFPKSNITFGAIRRARKALTTNP